MASRGSLGTFQTSDGYGKLAFTTSGKGSDLTLQRGQTIYALNSNISITSSNILSTIANVHSAIPAISSGGNIFLGAAGVPNGQNSNVFTPSVSIHYWKNGDEKEFYKGVKNANDATSASVNENTIHNYASLTKLVVAMMYARMKTLGIIGNLKRVDEIYPQMRNINFVESYLSTTFANVISDYGLGSNTQTVYKLSTDVVGFYLPGVQGYVTPNYFAGPAGTGVMLSNNYVHMYDFDATVTKYTRDLKIATNYPASRYTVTQAGKAIFNYDFTSNAALGAGFGLLGSIGQVALNCGFSPVIQAFEQNSKGSVPGDIIAYKLKQSTGGTITGTSAVASGYGFNILGQNVLVNDPEYSNSYTATFSSSNLYTPVYTTQYVANVGTSSIFVNGTKISKTKFGGLLDAIYGVHPLSIPTGVTYNQAYTDNPYMAFLGGAQVGPIESLASNVFYSPLSSNLYINVSTSTRPLYLDDVFSESVGFACGFEQGAFGNGTYGAVWGGGNNQYDSPIGYNATADRVKGLGLNLISELARSSVCLASNTNPMNHYILDTSSNVSNITSNTVVLPAAFNCNVNGNTFFTNFLNNFAGQTYVQLLPHGVFNYNSSGGIGVACLTELYNRYYGTSNTFAEILRKELLDPVGSNMGFGYEAGPLADFSTTWLVTPTNFSYYIPADNPGDGLSGLNVSNVNSFFGKFVADQAALPASQRIYVGALGLCGTLKDYSKVLRILARKGLDPNGNVILSRQSIADITTPRIQAVEFTGTQKYCASYLTLAFGHIASAWALGGSVTGPGYSNPNTVDPALTSVSNPIGREIRDAFGSASVWFPISINTPHRAISTGGATGIYQSTSLDEEAVVVYSGQDSGSEFQFMLREAIMKGVSEDISHPKSNTYVYSSSGVAVPLVPEIIGGME